MIMNFPPCPSFGLGEHPYGLWDDVFNEEDIELIKKYELTLPFQQAEVMGRKKGDKELDGIRSTAIGWIPYDEHSNWLYNRLALAARAINGKYFDFDLWGFAEHIQYTVYEPNDAYDFVTTHDGHYDWHVDRGTTNDARMNPRKLSLVIQLSDPSEYKGGDLQILTGGAPATIPKKKGLIAAFPSFALHRVTPVTSGIRRTLVIWITGPRFK